MPKVTSIKESHKKVRQKMEEVDCTYTFVGSELQIDTFSTTEEGKNAQTIRFTPEAQKMIVEIILNKHIK